MITILTISALLLILEAAKHRIRSAAYRRRERHWVTSNVIEHELPKGFPHDLQPIIRADEVWS